MFWFILCLIINVISSYYMSFTFYFFNYFFNIWWFSIFKVNGWYSFAADELGRPGVWLHQSIWFSFVDKQNHPSRVLHARSSVPALPLVWPRADVSALPSKSLLQPQTVSCSSALHSFIILLILKQMNIPLDSGSFRVIFRSECIKRKEASAFEISTFLFFFLNWTWSALLCSCCSSYQRRQHLIDVTEVFNQLSREKRRRLLKLISVVILILISLLW